MNAMVNPSKTRQQCLDFNFEHFNAILFNPASNDIWPLSIALWLVFNVAAGLKAIAPLAKTVPKADDVWHDFCFSNIYTIAWYKTC